MTQQEREERLYRPTPSVDLPLLIIYAFMLISTAVIGLRMTVW